MSETSEPAADEPAAAPAPARRGARMPAPANATPAKAPAERLDTDGPGAYRYDGPAERTYAEVPVTVQPGDVVQLPRRLDVHWSPTDASPTRLPDNHPDTEPAEAAPSESE
jgi:hypothetical protein